DRRAPRLLSRARRARGRARVLDRPMTLRDRRIAEMGLGPVWKLRSRPTPARPEPPGPSKAEAPAAKDDAAAKIKLHPSWKSRLLEEFSKPYMNDLREF